MPIETSGAVLGLAVLDTLSPAVAGVTLSLLLAGPRRPGTLLGAYLGTVAAAYFALGVLLMLGLGALVPLVDDAVRSWGQVAAGVALVVASHRIPDRDPGRAPTEGRSFTLRSMVLLGLGTWLLEFATALPYFGAIGLMTSAGLSAAQWSALLAAYVAVMVAPGAVLFAVDRVLGRRVRGRFERWRAGLSGGSRSAVRWIVGIAGVLLVLDALPEHVSVTVGR